MGFLASILMAVLWKWRLKLAETSNQQIHISPGFMFWVLSEKGATEMEITVLFITSILLHLIEKGKKWIELPQDLFLKMNNSC